MKASDKKFTDSFLKGSLTLPAMSKGTLTAHKEDGENRLFGGSLLGSVDTNSNTAYYGYSYGNVSQTFINYFKKTAKKLGMKVEYNPDYSGK